MANVGVLEVLLEYAEGLTERNLLSCLNCLNCFNAWDASRPYISLKYGNQEHTSHVARGGEGDKFVWNQKFRFQVEENLQQYNKLTLQVMDKHHLHENDILGEATTYLKDVVILGMEKGKAEIGSQKLRLVRPDDTYSGDISISVAFKRKDGMEEETLGGWKESTSDA